MVNTFNSPVKVAHKYWTEILEPTDTVIDATLGNGQDAFFLEPLCGNLIGIDIQEQAIISAKKLLNSAKIQYIHGTHASFPHYLMPQSVKLIVYNLGYLPRGDKSIVTKTESTLQSLSNAIPLIMPGGMISVTCYSGHNEGAKEEKAVMEFASRLDPKEWCSCHQRWLNRELCPSLVLMTRQL